MPDQHPLTWRDGTPVSQRFDDPFYALSDGLAETRHVFLDGNDLPARFRAGFHLAELGFGTGLNLLAVWALWQRSGQHGPLRMTSFEAFPLGAGDMLTAQEAFPELAPQANALAPFWRSGATRIDLPDLQFRMIRGDARETVPCWDDQADAWFLDGFAPARNPELWEPALLQQVVQRLRPGGTLATYTAAGHVRRALAAAGLEVTRTPGYGRKRHMTRARKPPA